MGAVMFRNACEIAGDYTWPILIYKRNHDGSCVSSLGACVILNDEGWALTAAHMLIKFETFGQEMQKIQGLEDQIVQIRAGSLNRNAKHKQLKTVGKELDQTATNVGAFWGRPGVSISRHIYFAMPDRSKINGHLLVDIAAVKLDPFDPAWVTNYASLKDLRTDCPIGASLCRLGFPFWNIQVVWDDQKNQFALPANTFPIPRFAIEGILSRQIEAPDQSISVTGTNKHIKIHVLETTSPGLKGQSGGAIFDTDGHVWGIQGRTVHYPLGFNPPKPDNPNATEHQFLNAGQGTSTITIMDFLDAYGINYSTMP